MRLAVLAFATALLASPQADPDALLAQARVRLQAVARRLEKYVCVETVNRSYYRRIEPRETQSPDPPAACGPTDTGAAASRATRELESTDRVRLEVTIAHSHELHSWPGATGFDTRDVDELIRDGPVSTGAFGAYLSSIFEHPGVTFHFTAERPADGKPVLEYSYSVPREASLLKVKTGDTWTVVPFGGEFWINRESLDLVRLVVRIDHAPQESSFCQAATTLDYQTVRIGDSDVLLPRQAQLAIEQSGGRQTQNDISFASCREYQAESELVFNEPADAGTIAAPRPGRGRLVIPIGLPVTLALESPIDTDTAATGDPVSAKVVKSVRRSGSKDDVIPAGAIVHGRIRRIEHHLFPKPYFLIAMAFNRVDVNGMLSPFGAHSEPDPPLAKDLSANTEIRANGIWFWDVGTFLFPTSKPRYVMPAGYETKWFTLATGR